MSDATLGPRIHEALVSNQARPRELVHEYYIPVPPAAPPAPTEDHQYANEQIEVDLQSVGLCELTSESTHLYGLAPGASRLFATYGLPVVSMDLGLTQQEGLSAPRMPAGRALLVATGTVTATRAELAEAAKRPLPGQLERDIEDQRKRDFMTEAKAYAPSDFTGSDRQALRDLEVRARALAPRAVESEWATRALLSLPVAFAGAVSFDSAVYAIGKALEEHVTNDLRPSLRYAYKMPRNGMPGGTLQVERIPAAWPPGLVRPETVSHEMTRVLASGRSAWEWGELLRDPPEGVRARLKNFLDPGAWDRIVGGVISSGAAELRLEVFASALAAEGLVKSATSLSNAQKIRLSVALREAGYEQYLATDDQGSRYRAWRRTERAA